MQIKDKVAVVTGGASGLGRATVRMLNQAGAQVAMFDMNEDEGTRYAKELGDETSLFVATDVSDEAAVVRAIDAVVENEMLGEDLSENPLAAPVAVEVSERYESAPLWTMLAVTPAPEELIASAMSSSVPLVILIATGPPCSASMRRQ